MSCLSEMALQKHDLSAKSLNLIDKFNANYEATPFNVENGANTALVKELEKTDIIA